MPSRASGPMITGGCRLSGLPAYHAAITASPVPATGSGASPSVSTSGPPNWVT